MADHFGERIIPGTSRTDGYTTIYPGVPEYCIVLNNPLRTPALPEPGVYKRFGILVIGIPDVRYNPFLEEIHEIKGDSIETVMIRENGIYELNLPSLLEDDSIIVSDEEGMYVIDINFLLKKQMKEKNKS